MTLALSPLLPASMNRQAVAALAGFVLLVSYYYFAGTWLLWGKTIGGTIFDVRVISAGNDAMAFRQATQRWLGLCLSLITGGIGFALAALPSRLSLADRLSRTRCVSAV
ncbi:MAG TPA: RDD family protein [Thermoanaerobaculia bacterium]|nr:RDD family protein [Thermoanaerobaculia bacterium]